MQPWHDAHGARPIVAGQWIRPEHYGDPAAEVRNVRNNVGIIDVTPLGKLDLRGPDVPTLLNFLYVNKWSKLDIGSVRYGVMCGEDGVVVDDGVTGHLGPDHYFMSTTSSGAAAVHEWIESWLQTTFASLQVHVTSVLSAYASINIAGPRSRELLGRLVDGVDLSADAFKYMQVRTGSIAGIAGLPHVADRLHRRAELRDSRAGRLRPARLGDVDVAGLRPRRRRRSVSRHSASCASRRATSSSARTPTA